MTAPSFADLLDQAVTAPGLIAEAYSAFHAYSIGNQISALLQCQARGLRPGPLATFPRWRELGRHVRRGEHALTLCMPITGKAATRRPADATAADQPEADVEPSHVYTRFVFRPRWFVLAQTEGQDLAPEPIPTWDRTRALDALAITEIPFDLCDGNVLGFARGRMIAVSPLNPLPHKTTFHEAAHVLLGHTTEGEQADGERTPRSLRECEAEAVALLCCAALELPGVAEARGYVQHWWGHGNPIPERSAQRILKVADEILKGGRP